jgi:hypothetical protein
MRKQVIMLQHVTHNLLGLFNTRTPSDELVLSREPSDDEAERGVKGGSHLLGV